MSQKFGIIVLLLATLGAPTVTADHNPPAPPITYTMSFVATNTGGTAPTAGQFTWNPSSDTITGFTVTWFGTEFNLTIPANQPIHSTLPACFNGETGAAAATYRFLC